MAARFPPLEGSREAVLAWLGEHGVEGAAVSAGTDMIEAKIPVGVAEGMFGTRFFHFLHKSRKADLIRAVRQYTVPEKVASMLYMVGNLVQLPAITGPRIVNTSVPGVGDEEVASFPNGCGNGCAGKVTPSVLAQAYGIEDAPTNQHTSMAVAEFQGVAYDNKDLAYFQKTCQLKTPVQVARQVGMNPSATCYIPVLGAELCLEALLDVEYIKAVAGDIPLTAITDAQYSLLNWAKQLDGLADLPLVHSVSYGNDEVQQTSTEFMDSVNAQFMKLGARGVSVLFASGDQGVYGRSGVTSDGKFHPDFPAASPYITAVGGTDFAQKSVIGAEKAWSDGGGGFSDHFPAPEYQTQAVQAYLSAAGQQGVLPRASSFNAKGRGYPDVAALGGQVNPYCVGASLAIVSSMVGVAGTSASCPVFAGIVARLNALRIDKGSPPLGFLNPFIYQNPSAFNDVTQGKNSGAGSQGFEAIAGWDPATGFGTPNFPKLRDASARAIEGTVASVVV